MNKVKVFTVLKSIGQNNKGGSIYTPEHVYAIENMCKNHISNFEFICLSDIDLECNTIKLENNWPGWWSKIELFKQKGPAIYFDLDLIIHDNIDHIIKKISHTELSGLKDQWHPGDMNSSVMYWKGDMEFIYNNFKENPSKFIQTYKGDQDFIGAQLKNREYIQDFCEGEVVSFKANIDYGTGFNPTQHKIIFFHGPPRPWEQNIINYEQYTR